MTDPEPNAERMSDDQLASELAELVAASHADELSDADALRLNELLETSQLAREIFLRLAHDTQSLRVWAAANLRPGDKPPAPPVGVSDDHPLALSEVTFPPAAGLSSTSLSSTGLPCTDPSNTGLPGADSPGSCGFFSSWTHLTPFWVGCGGVIVGAALIAVGTVFGWRLHDGMSGPMHLPAPQTAITPVAYLTSANGCAWGGDSLQTWTVGHSVESGSEVSLHEGIAEFRLASGVSLGIEGPASMLLVSSSKLVLQYGKVTAHVPWGSDDFRIITADCRISTHEAEFGVDLRSSKLDIHVFSGEVLAASSIASGSGGDEFSTIHDGFVADPLEGYFTEAVISFGRSLRLYSDDNLLKVAGWNKANPALFVAKLSMSGALPVTEEYVATIKSARPVGYWRFDRIVDSCVPNEIASGPELVLSGESSLVGSKENLSAEFRPNGDYGLHSDMRLPLANSDYSIEAWAKPSHLHRGSIATLTCRQDDRYSGIRLELQGAQRESYNRKYPGVVRFHHYRDYNREANEFGTSCFSSKPYTMRRWQHIVAVKHGSQMKLYVNGKLAGSDLNASTLPKNVSLHIGVESDRRSRRFVGQMDEIAIYDRALTDTEINRHYKIIEQATKLPKSQENSPRPTAGAQAKEV